MSTDTKLCLAGFIVGVLAAVVVVVCNATC